MEKRFLVNETTTVDTSTGEVLTTSKKFAVRQTVEEFYMTFINFIKPFYELTSGTDIKLLTWMCTKAEYNTGRVLITPDIRKEIVILLGVTAQQISNSITALKNKNLLKGSRGTYYINPEIYWKGSMDARKGLMEQYPKLTINFKLEE